MILQSGVAPTVQPGDAGCWTAIGVTGDRSCPRLAQHAHCRNCEAYTAAAARLLDRVPPDGYVVEATRHYAQSKATELARTVSVVVFRVGGEWLALPTAVVVEITAPRRVHSLPHRRGGALLGLVSLRGELLVCVGLPRLLGGTDAPADGGDRGRFVVVQAPTGRVVFPVDEVRGVHRFHPSEAQPAPSASSRASALAPTLVHWRDLPVGCLDHERLFPAVDRLLA